MRARLLFPAAALLACGCTPNSADESASTEDTGAIYPLSPPTPGWTADDIATRLDEFLSYGTPNPLSVAESYMKLMAHGSEICPGSATAYEHPTGVEGCTTDDGYHFEGVAWYSVEDYTTDGMPAVWKHGGDFLISTPDGQTLSGGGEIEYEGSTGELPEDPYYSFELYGSWQDDQRTDWMGNDFSAVYEASGGGAQDEQWTSLTGGMGISSIYLDFSGLTFAYASACPWEAEGWVGMRDDAGYWYQWEYELDCDPCASVVFQPTGETVGELCTDLADFGEELYRNQAPRSMNL